MYLKEILRLHALYLAGDPAGVRANLTGADLRWANLTGANLTRADLTGADLTGTKVFTFQADPYRGYTVPGVDGKRILQFGCVRLTLDEWDSQHDELAATHEPARAANFAAGTRALVAYCRTLD